MHIDTRESRTHVSAALHCNREVRALKMLVHLLPASWRARANRHKWVTNSCESCITAKSNISWTKNNSQLVCLSIICLRKYTQVSHELKKIATYLENQWSATGGNVIHICQTALHISKRHWKDTQVSHELKKVGPLFRGTHGPQRGKMSYISAKQPYTSAKETCKMTSTANLPLVSRNVSSTNNQKSLHVYRKALYTRKLAAHICKAALYIR